MTEKQYKTLKSMKNTLDAVLEDYEKSLQPKTEKKDSYKEVRMAEIERSYATGKWRKPTSLRKVK